MSQGFQAIPAELTNHASAVDRLGDQLVAAGDKGRGVDLGVGTYGLIGQVFSINVRSKIAKTSESINKMGAALKDTAEAVRDAAETYRVMDEHNAGLFGGR